LVLFDEFWFASRSYERDGNVEKSDQEEGEERRKGGGKLTYHGTADATT
jgi:hypothetical protein